MAEKIFSDYLGKEVVVDTNGSFVYLGILKKLGEDWIELGPVDVHDSNDSISNKENYILKMAAGSIKHNRSSCRVRLDKVISLSLIEEIEQY